jgi:beta-lactamase regulating signal transducer with metallopeptidase domain/uncharacterized GH25 family protein
MNTLWQWTAAPEWALVVGALLHTVWQGAVLAVTLALLLRRLASPSARYRCSLVALVALAFAGVVTWAVLHSAENGSSRTSVAPSIIPGIAQSRDEKTTPTAPVSSHVSLPVGKPDNLRSRGESRSALPGNPQWTGSLTLAWMLGAVLMLMRAALQVAGADGLRRSSRPLSDPVVAKLLDDARNALRLTRKVRAAITDKVTSPAVVGVLVPVLIVPLSLLSALSPEQLRFVLLHELAHIRRGDYFAHVFQLLVEALLFFNPAAWWISQQVRREREACCDAIAVELSGAPTDYARTLVRVAENLLQPLPAAALGFAAEREPSSLAERVQRMLVPGYRPSLRLTWRATRVTVAAILSPGERIERIEQKMAEYGVRTGVTDDAGRENLEKVAVTARVRIVDGSPLPRRPRVFIHSSHGNSSGIHAANVSKDGIASNNVPSGNIWLEADIDGYAPAISRRFDSSTTNFIDAGELLIDRGFEITLQLSDAESGQPVTNGAVRAAFLLRDTGSYLQRRYDVRPDSSGRVTLTPCVDERLNLTVSAPGYTILDQQLERLNERRTIDVKLRPGAVFDGRVIDRTTGQPIAGATIRVIHKNGPTDAHYGWTDPSRLLAQTDATGKFSVTQLRRGTKYWLGISAPAHESVILEVTSEESGAVVKLGPELIVRGRVLGGLDGLQQIDGHRVLHRSWSEIIENTSRGEGEWVRLQRTNTSTTFQFTIRVAGPVTLSGAGYWETRDVTAPIDDWIVDLTAPSPETKYLAENMPKREVIFRFTHPSGVPPRGTVAVTVPDRLDPKRLTAHTEEKAITNGEVRVDIAIGGRTGIEPRRMIGYGFDKFGENHRLSSILVSNGTGPLIIEIPLVAAGALYVTARNADGSPAHGLFFGVEHIAPPGRRGFFSRELGSASRQDETWVSGPLPLGDTYQAFGWRGNSFCVSRHVQLTGQEPDAEVELQFPAGERFEGLVLDADGNPLSDLEVKPSFHLNNDHSFGLQSVLTDDGGRFRLQDTTPTLGEYFVELKAPGLMAERVQLDFGSQPQAIRLQRGRSLAGRVVEAATGQVIPHAEVRVANLQRGDRPMLKAHTDEEGRFEFTSLADAEYTFFVEGAQLASDKKLRADNSTNIILAVKLYEWSELKPKGR